MIEFLRLFAIVAIAFTMGKLVSQVKLPAILGWLITGMVFGPCIVGVVTPEILEATWYKILIKVFECLAGVMIGSEIIFKQLKKSGLQLTVVTLFQSLGTFAVVTAAFAVALAIAQLPLYPAFIFGGIALATAPAPALSIVNEFKTDGPVTRALIPMAALDDIVGVIVFFTTISIITATVGGEGISPLFVVLSVLLPFVIGGPLGVGFGFIIKAKRVNRPIFGFLLMILGLATSIVIGLVCDKYLFGSFMLNYILIGMSFAAGLVNVVPKEKMREIFRLYNPILWLSLVVVIINLGMPLDYRFIASAGVFTAVYIIARAVGKIGGAALGGHVMKVPPTVKKYLGLTLLPHSGVSLVFTGIAVSSLQSVAPEITQIIQGTIAAAAIINEIIAVVLAKQAFKWAHEFNKKGLVYDKYDVDNIEKAKLINRTKPVTENIAEDSATDTDLLDDSPAETSILNDFETEIDNDEL